MKKILVVVGIALAAAAAVVLTRKTPIDQPDAPVGTWEPAEPTT